MCIIKEALYKETQIKAFYISTQHRPAEETSHTGYTMEEHLKKSNVAAVKLSFGYYTN